MRRVPRGDRLVALLLLGGLAFSPAFLSIFRVDAFLFGVPVLYLYLFSAWMILILLTAIAGDGWRRRASTRRRKS